MPEGPEVRIIANDWQRMVGLELTSAISSHNRYISIMDKITECFRPHLIKVYSVGKILLLEFSNVNDVSFTLLCRFGLSGKWSYVSTKSIRFTLVFGDINVNYLDPINIGSISFMSTQAVSKELSVLGPDVLNLTLDHFKHICKSNKLICTLLTDQSTISGIGNYLRSDILYTAKILPTRRASELCDDDIVRLYNAIILTYNNSLEHGGISLVNYTMLNQSGKYNPIIYKQHKTLCGETIQNFVVGGQKIYWVPV